MGDENLKKLRLDDDEDGFPADVRVKLDALKAEHGQLRVFLYGDTWVALRPATHHEVQSHRKMLFDATERPKAFRYLFKELCVLPSKEDYGAFIKKYQAAPEASTAEIQAVIGWKDVSGKDF